jgi:hypothetical protein
MPQIADDIVIDAEFAALIPPLSSEERRQLEDNIVEHGGARDPLVVWVCDGTLTLLDGHNRYEICTRLGLPFDVHEMRFSSRDEAEDWIDKNQLGRRNLTADAFTLLLGRRYNRAKKAERDGGKGRPRRGDQNDQQLNDRRQAGRRARRWICDRPTCREVCRRGR